MTPEQMELLLTRMESRMARRDRRWAVLWLAALALAVPGFMRAANVTVPNTFASGAVASASQVNQNFAALTSEATRVSNIVEGTGNGSTNDSRVVNLAAPLANNDAAHKGYVDAMTAVAAGSGGGGGLVLFGTTSCPSGWTEAVTGRLYMSKDAANGIGVECIGATFEDTALSGTNWTRPHYQQNCVVCVK